MNTSIRLSKKYGVNPSIARCFWCGEDKNELILFGEIGEDDIEAPRHVMMNYDPCDQCMRNWDLGVTVIEVSNEPSFENQIEIQNGIFPTGHWSVITDEAAERIFGDYTRERRTLLVDSDLYLDIGLKELK